MKQQNYNNHIRFYPAHHFIFYPLLMLALAGSVYGYVYALDARWTWMMLIILVVLTLWLSVMLRQHYALMLQNRIVKQEMRFRYFMITRERFDLFEDRLSFAQIAALRFAGDDELEALTKRALTENLSADQIKQAIHNWKEDDMRV